MAEITSDGYPEPAALTPGDVEPSHSRMSAANGGTRGGWSAWASGLAPVAILIALPLLLLMLDCTWIFPRPDTVDPWMYVGFFLKPKFMLNVFPSAYHGTRLPIVLPGTAFFHLFRADLAIILLHLTLYYACIFSLYFGLRALVGVRAALLVAVLAGTNAMFLSTMGQTQADAFGVTYALVTAALVIGATTGGRWRLPLFLAGGSYSLFLFTNIAYLPLSILFPWLLITLPRDREKKNLAVGFALVLAGFVTGTLALCLINLELCGRFGFFMPWVVAMTRLNRAACHSPPRLWLPHACWLVFPLLVLGAIVVAWLTGWVRRSDRPAVSRSLLGGFLLVFAIMAGSEFANITHCLQFSFYASLILPALFLGAGALVGLGKPDGWSQHSYCLALVIAIGLGACSIFPVNGSSAQLLNTWGLPLLVAAMGLLLFVRPASMDTFALPLSVCLVMVANILVSYNYERFLASYPLERCQGNGHKYVGTWKDHASSKIHAQNRAGLTRQQAFLVACDAYRCITDNDTDPRGDCIRLWYPLQDRHGSLFSAICSTYMWNQRMFSLQFPDMVDQDHRPRSMREMRRLAVLGDSARPLLAETRRVALALDFNVTLVHQFEFEKTHGVPIQMLIIEVRERH